MGKYGGKKQVLLAPSPTGEYCGICSRKICSFPTIAQYTRLWPSGLASLSRKALAAGYLLITKSP